MRTENCARAGRAQSRKAVALILYARLPVQRYFEPAWHSQPPSRSGSGDRSGQAPVRGAPRTVASDIFGRLAIRSAYRSSAVNAFGNAHHHNCASNERNYGRHIWDRRDARGNMGAMACIVVPWFADRFPESTPWQAMAWWIHDHLPYSQLQFFPKLGAFNIGWQEYPKREIYSYIQPRGYLTRPGMPNHTGDHADQYQGFPAR